MKDGIVFFFYLNNTKNLLQSMCQICLLFLSISFFSKLVAARVLLLDFPRFGYDKKVSLHRAKQAANNMAGTYLHTGKPR